jgi:hypothetical protein
MPKSYLSSVVFCILPRQAHPATRGHQQENHPRNLQPQLMQHPSERPGHRRHGAGHGSHGPATLGLLRRHAPDYPDLSCRGYLAHGLDFSSLRRYNGANLR